MWRQTGSDDDQPRQPRPASEGAPARKRRGAFGKTWWSERWLASLEEITDEGRLARGRSYARNGRVTAIAEEGPRVCARVQGSERTPHTVYLSLAHLPDSAWDDLLAALRTQASYVARLLSAEMPDDIQEAFDAAGVTLFPVSDEDITASCTCWDWVRPCKHVAAVYYVLSQRFDDDPFLLFRLRGRTQEQVMRALLGSGQEDEVGGDGNDRRFAPPPDSAAPGFWQATKPLDDVHISIHPPVVRLPVLRRLGEPPFGANLKLAARLGPKLDAISAAALAAAYRKEEGAGGGEDAAK